MRNAKSTGRPNHLIDSRSPYLLEHAYNPVDWYPWGLEALKLSRVRGVPIFLSIGYSVCHWCHVMAREVFENPAIARYMNEHFVNIKVDREERPDLDELYMLATQITTGSGGWPMSVWLTPDQKPFYAGTYFPPEDRYGRPGFPAVLSAIRKAWRDNRDQVLEQANHIALAIADYLRRSGDPGRTLKPASWISQALTECQRRMDLTWGGFTGAPKFPPHQALLFFIALLEPDVPDTPPMEFSLSGISRSEIQTWLVTTLDHMAAGGIYDQLAGGFARYSTDEQWLVPHFEKMLYDNAQLALIYARAGALLHRAEYQRIAMEILDFSLRDMTADSGLFYSSLDADSEGEEGKFYIWNWDDIVAAIPDETDRQLAGAYWDLTPQGNWEGRNIPRVIGDSVHLALRFGKSPDFVQGRLREVRSRMLAIRTTRVPPHRDDKILTGWNGLMIQALAQAALLLNEPRYYQAAGRAASSILRVHQDAGGHLLHVSRGERAAIPAFLEDEAYFGIAAWNLAAAARQFEPAMADSWLNIARRTAENIVNDFYQPETGIFFITGSRHDELFVRVPSGSDNAVPAAAAMAMALLVQPDLATEKINYKQVVLRGMARLAPLVEQHPLSFSTILSVLVEHPELAANLGTLCP
ncbi:MAG: thioredoxin domain-containing protein [Phycisphaerae bacterium]